MRHVLRLCRRDGLRQQAILHPADGRPAPRWPTRRHALGPARHLGCAGHSLGPNGGVASQSGVRYGATATQAPAPPAGALDCSHTYTSFAEGGLIEPSGGPRGCWARLGSLVQRRWLAPLVVLALGGLAVPFAIPLSQITYVEGLQPLLPRGDASTDAFKALQASFGVSQVFPNIIIVAPPNASDITNPEWLHAACLAMHSIADNVTATLQAQGIDYTMSHADLTGLMTYGGLCLNLLELVLERLPFEAAKHVLSALIDAFGNPQHTATKVHASTSLDPFDADGRAWISAMRVALAEHTVVGEFSLGEMYFTGMAQEQMDGAADTFASLPRVVGATLAIVCVVLLLAFRSLLVPLRAIVCLAWMLVATFGSATLVYQQGALTSLGVPFLAPAGGGLFWMAPCISFSIVVGLGLDYDIFLMESVIEYYDRGASPREALALALEATGNIICVAGVIMTLAFSALLVGSSAVLNQIGYLLIVGVLIDCFVTTKVVIPCAMALLPGNLNFWPRKPPRPVAETPPTPLSVDERERE